MRAEPRSLPGMAAEAFPAIDILKFVFAILIMCLHGDLFEGSLSGVYFERIIVRLAVPFFFVSSGFFYGKKVYAKDDLGAVTKNYVSRLAMKLLIFEPVSILLRVAQNIVSHHLSAQVIIREIVQNILFYPLGALWYIQAVIVAIIILVPFMKRKREGAAFLTGLLLYSFALLCNRYYFLCEGTILEPVITTYMRYFVSARNGLFVGLLYVSMGVLIARKWDVLKQKETLLSVLMLLAGLCLVLEVHFTNDKRGMDDNALFIAHLLLIPALFICAGCQKFSRAQNPIHTTVLRNLSTSIYLMHRPVLQIVEAAFEMVFHVYLQPWQITAMAGAVIALICLVVYRKKWNPLYNWIK